VQNHDLGYRTRTRTARRRPGHESDTFANNWPGGAGITRTFPHASGRSRGMFWKHYFDWGRGNLREKIKAACQLRGKSRRAPRGSVIDLQDNARSSGVLCRAASSAGTAISTSALAESDAQWEPSRSNYTAYREVRAGGRGGKVWVGLPGKPAASPCTAEGSVTDPLLPAGGADRRKRTLP